MTLNRRILALALPAIAANITTPLLSLADIAIVGHIGTAVLIAAITVGASMFNMLYWLFGFLRMGTSGITAQAYGADQAAVIRATLWRGLAMAVIAGVAIIACAEPLADVVIRFMDADAPTAAMAREYFLTGIWGAPAMLCTYVLTGWFLGMQSSRPIMWISLTVNLANIALSWTLVYCLGMGVRGTAIGTATAQWLAALAGLGYAMWRFREARPGRGIFAELADWPAVRRMLSVNSDIFARTICLIFVTLWFTRAGAAQGNLVLAANAMLMQLFMLFSFFMDGFAFAGEALAGRYYGAGDTAMLRRSIRRLMLWGLAMSAAAMAAYFFFGNGILGLLTDDRSALSVAAQYHMWAVLVPATGFMAFVWDGIYIGVTLTRRMFLSMLVAAAVFFVTWYVLHPALGNHALWLAFNAYLLSRALVQWILFPRHLSVNVSDKPTETK